MAIPNSFTPSSGWNDQTIETPSHYISLLHDYKEELSPAPPKPRQSSRVTLLFFSCLLAIGLLAALVKVDHHRNRKMLPFILNIENEVPSLSNSMKPSPEKAPRGLAEGVSPKSYPSLAATPSFTWTEKMLEWQRTAFHFQPKVNWMNDPNGPLFYKGWYHFFYQYNPHGAIWGDIVWGHAVSKDLINWHHLPLAMVPDKWYDINGVWTGSATMLHDGQIVMLYTGSTNESVQVQNLAYPVNPSDPFLKEWEKSPKNPVIVPPPGIHIKDFRDPTTAWFTPEGRWRFLIGSKVNTTGITLVYETDDFKTYELLDKMFHGVANTGMWECVDFYPVSTVEAKGLDTSDDGPAVKHVMKTSLDDDRNDYYAIGTYNGTSCEWIPDDPRIDVGIGLRYDYGSFYASKTFYDQEKNRRVLWGWITEKDSEASDIKKGWASVQAIPRTVLLDRKTGRNLLQWPVEEVEQLRWGGETFHKVAVDPGSIVPIDLNSATATQLDIVAEFEVSEKALNMVNVSNSEYTCTRSGGAAQRGAVGPFGFLVLADKDQSEQTAIYFYIAKGTDGNFITFFCADHSRSSQADDVVKGVYGDVVTVLGGENLKMRILVDHSIVESFAQGGRTCITSRIYPTKAIYEDAQLFLFNNATDATITVDFQVWEMTHEISSAKFLRPFCLYFSFFFGLVLILTEVFR